MSAGFARPFLPFKMLIARMGTILLFFAVCVPLSYEVWRKEREREEARKPVVEMISTIPEFEVAIKSHRCVLFPDSRAMLPQLKKKFSDFAHSWRHAHPNTVQFYRIDFTNPKGPLWDRVEQWMHAESIPEGGLKYYGCIGKFIWIRDSRSMGYNSAVDVYFQMPLEELDRRTQELLW